MMRIPAMLMVGLFATTTFADERARYREAISRLADLYQAEGMLAVEQRVAAQPARMRLTLLNGMIGRLYRTSRDIDAVVTAAERTLELGEAASIADPALRDRLGVVHYNLASYTWPGWGGDDAELVLTAAQVERGRRAAYANVLLHDLMDSPPRKRSNSRWMAAVHEIAAGNDPAALKLFAEMRRIAQAHELDSEDWIRGWELVISLLREVNDTRRIELDTLVARMSATQDGRVFADQFGVALQALAATPCATAVRCKGPDCLCVPDPEQSRR